MVQNFMAGEAPQPKKKSSPREILASSCILSFWGFLTLTYPRYANLDGADQTIVVILGYGMLALGAFAALGGIDTTNSSQLTRSIFTGMILGLLALLTHAFSNQFESGKMQALIRGVVLGFIGLGALMFGINVPKMLGEPGRSPLSALFPSSPQGAGESADSDREPRWTRVEGLVAVLIASLNIAAAAIQKWG